MPAEGAPVAHGIIPFRAGDSRAFSQRAVKFHRGVGHELHHQHHATCNSHLRNEGGSDASFARHGDDIPDGCVGEDAAQAELHEQHACDTPSV